MLAKTVSCRFGETYSRLPLASSCRSKIENTEAALFQVFIRSKRDQSQSEHAKLRAMHTAEMQTT